MRLAVLPLLLLAACASEFTPASADQQAAIRAQMNPPRCVSQLLQEKRAPTPDDAKRMCDCAANGFVGALSNDEAAMVLRVHLGNGRPSDVPLMEAMQPRMEAAAIRCGLGPR